MVDYVTMKRTQIPQDGDLPSTEGPGYLNRIHLPQHLKNPARKTDDDDSDDNDDEQKQLIVQLSLLISALRYGYESARMKFFSIKIS